MKAEFFQHEIPSYLLELEEKKIQIGKLMHSNAGGKYFDMLSEMCLIPGNLF